MDYFKSQMKIKNRRRAFIAGIITMLIIAVLLLFKIDKAIATLIILAFDCVLFITEMLPLIYTAAITPLMLYLCGALTVSQAFSGLSNENVILFVGMFIVGGAIFRTGAADAIGKVVLYKAGSNLKKLVLLLLILTALFSSVMSNTGSVAVLMPMCIGVADAGKIDRKKLLLPLAFMSSLGGMMTIVGTPPNLTVNTIYVGAGYESFGFFDFAYIGLPLTVIGGLYLLFVFGKSKGILIDCSHSQKPQPLNAKQKLSIAILFLVVIVMATGIVNLAIAAVIAAILCMAFGLCSGVNALEDIDWKTVILFAGMIPMSTALDKTGAGKMIADWSVEIMGGLPSEFIAISVLFAISAVLTQFMSNTASCALLAPIGLQIATSLNASPAGVLMAIGIASSCAFCTPMATPPNTLVFGSGKMNFKDFLKYGTPLLILGYLVCVIVIPMVWPFF